MADTKRRWCVKAKDGWHAARPNNPWPDGQNNVRTQCGHVIVLPYGCEKRYPSCAYCADAVRAKPTVDDREG